MEVGADDWLDRVAHIRAWTRHGVRAPHKPLLLLFLLGRLQRAAANRPISFSDAESPVKALLEEFGPPHPTSAAYPFHHLMSDGLWLVQTTDGPGSPGSNIRRLRASGATGELDPDFADALLADPGLFVRVANYLLDSNFPGTLHSDIAAAVGLDLDETPLERPIDLSLRRRRSSSFRDDVMLAYEGRCAMCGWDGRLGGEAVGVEAAHVRWFMIDGPDALDNGLCLCSLHHQLFDAGAIGLTLEREIAVSLRFVGQGEIAERLVYSLIGKRLDPPQSGLPPPASSYIEWHGAQVFRGPARMGA